MLSHPLSRTRLMAVLRAVAMTSGALPVELAVDLAGGVEFFGAPGEFLAGLEQRLFDFG